ncbi:DUF2283 domain-containing protein [Cyanobacteria bacterium FACHB-63]|nr:DUF2283 domain-containing protein [Cyanobacteria bacterium FACHB-63]
MKIVYDPDKNILQISLRRCAVAETAQVAPDLILDYDEDGQVIGLELRNASDQVENPFAITYAVEKANLDKPQAHRGYRET